MEVILSKDVKLKHPFAMIVSGPSQSGKTEFTRNLIYNMDKLINYPINNIYWFYSEYQQRYNEKIQGKLVNYINGLDIERFEKIGPNSLVIIDDLMEELSVSKKASVIFTRKVHHKNISIIFIVQNIFHQAKQMRNISLNCHYFVLLKNERDKNQIMTLAKQVEPTNARIVVHAYNDATSIPFGHLLVDCHPRNLKSLKLRSKIFDKIPVVYKMK